MNSVEAPQCGHRVLDAVDPVRRDLSDHEHNRELQSPRSAPDQPATGTVLPDERGRHCKGGPKGRHVQDVESDPAHVGAQRAGIDRPSVVALWVDRLGQADQSRQQTPDHHRADHVADFPRSSGDGPIRESLDLTTAARWSARRFHGRGFKSAGSVFALTEPCRALFSEHPISGIACPLSYGASAAKKELEDCPRRGS